MKFSVRLYIITNNKNNSDNWSRHRPVSYTHLDVYKRQPFGIREFNEFASTPVHGEETQFHEASGQNIRSTYHNVLYV